jgi:hypothetical protein
MTEQKDFERRPSPELRQAWGDYKVEMAAIGKKLTLKQWIIGLLAIYAGIHILVQSNNEEVARAAVASSARAVASVEPDTLVKPKCVATLGDYNTVRDGMSRREVAAIIGCPGTELNSVSYDGKDSVLVSWPGPNGMFSSMDATFDNDQLVGKGRWGWTSHLRSERGGSLAGQSGCHLSFRRHFEAIASRPFSSNGVILKCLDQSYLRSRSQACLQPPLMLGGTWVT